MKLQIVMVDWISIRKQGLHNFWRFSRKWICAKVLGVATEKIKNRSNGKIREEEASEIQDWKWWYPVKISIFALIFKLQGGCACIIYWRLIKVCAKLRWLRSVLKKMSRRWLSLSQTLLLKSLKEVRRILVRKIFSQKKSIFRKFIDL